LEPFAHTVPFCNNTRKNPSPDAAETTGDPNPAAGPGVYDLGKGVTPGPITGTSGPTSSVCAGVDVYPDPATTRFDPNTVTGCDFVSDPDVAVTVTTDPGFAHGVPRSSFVVAFPEPSVVADAGVKDAPDAATPEELFNDAVTVTAPAAGTCKLGVDTVSRALDTANAGDADINTIAGTAHAVPATTARRLRPEPDPPA
jgi:hypothetical protein